MNIAADDQCLTEFENLKYNKIEARYITFVIVDEKIVIQRVGNKNQTWEDFLETLPQNDYRYVVFDFAFTNADNMHMNKLIFLSWNPEGSPLKKRVLYATAKENFKSYLDMNNKDYTLNSKSDVFIDEQLVDDERRYDQGAFKMMIRLSPKIIKNITMPILSIQYLSNKESNLRWESSQGVSETPSCIIEQKQAFNEKQMLLKGLKAQGKNELFQQRKDKMDREGNLRSCDKREAPINFFSRRYFCFNLLFVQRISVFRYYSLSAVYTRCLPFQIFLNMISQSSQKDSISLWLGSNSKQLAYSYYHMASQQIFDESEDPINQSTIYKSLSKYQPRMIIFDTQIDRLKAIRQVDHQKMIKKIQNKNSGSMGMGFQGYFNHIDISGMMNYNKEEPKAETEQWGQFCNWHDTQSNYFLVDSNYSPLQLDQSKPVSLDGLLVSYEHHQQYYKNCEDKVQNKIRKQLEECDYLKYIGINTDQLFEGFTVKVLEYLNDECPKLCKAVTSLACAQKQGELLLSLPTLSQINELTDIYLPISQLHYSPFELSHPQLYDEVCRKRLQKNLNLAPLLHAFYIPFNMKNVNVDQYVSSIVKSNRKIFNSASFIPIIRENGELGPEREGDKSEYDQGIFRYQQASRRVWNQIFGQKKQSNIFKQKEDQQKYFFNFTNDSYLSVGPKGDFLSQSYVLKGHFNAIQNVLKPKSQNFSLKYLEGIFSCGENPKINYVKSSESFPHDYSRYYGHEHKTIQSFPYQSVFFNHESFGSNIRMVIKSKFKQSKIFRENLQEWKQKVLEIADCYQEDHHDSDQDA